MRRLGFLFILASVPAWSSAILETDVTRFQNSDSVLWSQFAGDPVQQTFFPSTSNYQQITGRFDNGEGAILTAGKDIAATGGIENGDSLLSTTNGSAPVTLYLNPVYGAGAFIQGTASSQFTARIQAFSGIMSVLDTTVTSDKLGDAIFVGVADNTAEITKIIYSMSSGLATDFVMDTFHIQTQQFVTISSPQPVIVVAPAATNPEPGTASLLALAFAASVFVYRKRAKRT